MRSSNLRRFEFERGELLWIAKPPRIVMGAPTLNITHWRFRDDDIASPDSTPTWLDSGEDGNPSSSITTGTANSFAIRVQADEVNNKTGSWTLQLNYENITQSTGVVAVSSGSNHIQMYGATSRGGISDDTAITVSRLTSAPAGSFDNGNCDTATGSRSYTTGSNGAWTELEFIVYIVDVDVNHADQIRLSITGHNGTGGTLGTLTVNKPAPTFVFPLGSLGLLGVGK